MLFKDYDILNKLGLRLVFILTLLFFVNHNSYADNWIKVYSNGNKSANASSMALFSNGNMAFSGITSNSEALVIITSSDGKVLKEQEFKNTSIINKIIITQDNNIFICGISDSTGIYGTNFFWMKLDPNLNILWAGSSDRIFNDVCESGIQYSDGTFYIVGYGSRTGNNLSDRDALIYHIDANGNIIKSKISSSFGADYFNNIKELPDNSILVTGSKIWQVEMDVYLTKFNKDLGIISSKSYGGIDSEGGYDILIDNGNIFILGGTHTYGAGRYDVLLTKFDLNLTTLSTKAYGTPANESAYSILKLNNEICIIANIDTTNVVDSTLVPTKIIFIKTDLDGNYLSSTLFNKNGILNSLSSAAVSTNNEIIVSFSSNSFSKNGSFSHAILKTDSFKLYCCEFFNPIIISSEQINVTERPIGVSFNSAGNTLPFQTGINTLNYTLQKKCDIKKDTAQIKNSNNSTFCKNQPISFNANTSNTPVTGTWIFGDTIKMIDTAGVDVTFRFDTVGTFNVYFISYFQCNSDTDTISINIVNNKPYVVDLKKTGFCIGKPITFEVNFSSEEIIKYHWNFGVATITNDTSNLMAPQYTFINPGNYTIYLLSETYCGTKLDSILINIPDKNYVEIDNSIKTYCKNFAVPFGISANELPDQTLWNFGDPSSSSNTSSDINSSHIYTKPGDYIISVISDFSCNSDTDTIHVKIVDYFVSPAKINYTGFCVNEPFDFSVSDVLTNPTYFWEIENNAGITKYYTKSINHQFLTNGEYTIRVSVSDNNCNLGSDTIEINVAEFIIAGITNINDPCLQNLILTPSNPTPNVIWKLSNGFTSTENTLIYTFPASGDYEVLLITNPNSNCADSTTVSVPFIKENANGGIYIPQVFSPNGDGKNDVFIIENTTNNPCRLISFKVYDRWGKIMHKVDKFDTFSWDGKNQGRTVMPGSYIGFLETDNGSKSFVINVVY